MSQRLNKLGRLNRLTSKQQRKDFLPGSLREKFLLLWTGEYTGDDLKDSLGSEAVITVTGKDWTTPHIPQESEATFSVPNVAAFIAADGHDDFWFNSSDVLQQKTHSNLISGMTFRTFVKYSDFAPYNVFAIGILKEGEILMEAEKHWLNRYFKLDAHYWGELMVTGYIKDNRSDEDERTASYLLSSRGTGAGVAAISFLNDRGSCS